MALVRPDAYAEFHEQILAKIREAGFKIAMEKEVQLSKEQVARLRDEHSVYMIDSSRANIAGINAGNVDYFAAAVAAVMKG